MKIVYQPNTVELKLLTASVTKKKMFFFYIDTRLMSASATQVCIFMKKFL